MKKNIFLLFFVPAAMLISCSKGTELGALEKDNVMDPENATDVFVLDSTRTRTTPTGPNYFIQLFYHIRYDLIKDTSRIYKIAVYRDGELYFKLLLDHANTYQPVDFDVYSGHYYTYTFALLEEGDHPSRLSAEHIVAFP